MNDLLNPYIAGAPVVEKSMFFGREEVFRWIEHSLTGKYVDHILVIHGQRRVGKTTVLKQIPNFLPDKYIQVFFDLQGRTSTTLDRFLWWMASEILRTLNKTLNSDLPRIKRDQFSDPDTFITEFIPNLKPSLDDHMLLLTFDEFDSLSREDIQETLTRPLIGFLRHLFDIEGLNFIFSIGSSGNKLENMQAAYTDFFKTALYRKISFLTEDDCFNLITKPIADIITYQPEAIQRIIEITSGHPYFTQLTCHELFSRCQINGSRTITKDDVEAILGDVIERGTVNLKFVWDEASDLEKWILAVLGKEDGLSQKMIKQALQSQGVRFSVSDLNSAILHLRDKDVITRDNHLLIHLMKQWLEINRPIERVREELVQTNPIADRYVEIGDEYRERERLEDAINSYEQALTMQANNLTALVNIGGIQLEQGSYQRAATSFEKALQVDSEHIAARQGYCQSQLSLGDRARQNGDITDAVSAYQSIINLTPVHQQARQNLAKIYKDQAETSLSSGDDQGALEHLSLAMEMTPEDEDLKTRRQQIVDEKKAALIKTWMDKAEKALKRKRWDEAVKMAQEALNVDPDDKLMQQRVADIKDTPRQEKLKACRQDAETAISKGDYPKAIQAMETATLLAPEDTDLQSWLTSIRVDQQHAQLRLYQTQAERAQASGDWEAAIAARELAIKLDPSNKSLAEALTKTKANHKNAQLRKYRLQAETAQASGDWEAAIAAREKAIKLDPEDESLSEALAKTKADHKDAQLIKYHRQAETAQASGDWEAAITAREQAIQLAPEDEKLAQALEETKTAQRQAKLDGLLSQADNASKMENWSKAVSSWEAYLDEVPEDAEKLDDHLDHARKYALISADYAVAQEHLRKKQFNRAISKLQGIIAQDPAYKSTSRLLVEAVEARGQYKPANKSLWLIAVIAVVLLVVIGFIFSDRILALFNPSPKETPVSALETPKFSQTPTSLAPTKTEINVVAEFDEEKQSTSTITATISATKTLEPTETRTPRNTPTPKNTPTPRTWLTNFAEPILAYIADSPPIFEDQFNINVENENDTYGDAWVFDTRCDPAKRSLSVKDGELNINCTINNKLITFQDYVVDVDLRQTWGAPGIVFNRDSCKVFLGIDRLLVYCDEKLILSKFYTKLPTSMVNLRLMVKGSQAAIFIDQSPKGYFTIDNKGGWLFISLNCNQGFSCEFDNFKVWSLSNFTLP